MTISHRPVPERGGRPPATPPTESPVPHRWYRWILPIGLVMMTAVLLIVPTVTASTPEAFSYTAFVNEVTTDKVATATITDTGAVTGTLVGGAAYTSRIPTALNDGTLSSLLLTHK